jgi:uncharacterized protein YecE (DUF72 family)
MPQLFVGTSPLPHRFERYWGAMNAVELLDAARTPIRLRVLRRLRRTAGEGFAFCLPVWHWLVEDPLDIDEAPPLDLPVREIGRLRETASNARLFEEVRLQIEALRPRWVSVRTPSSFTPTEENRAALVAFFRERLVPLGVTPVWEARGLWTRDEVRELARDAGGLAMLDPFADFEFPPVGEGEALYAIHQPRGRRMFSREDYEDLVSFVQAHEGDVTVFFRGPDREQNAAVMRRTHPEEVFESDPDGWTAQGPQTGTAALWTDGEDGDEEEGDEGDEEA